MTAVLIIVTLIDILLSMFLTNAQVQIKQLCGVSNSDLVVQVKIYTLSALGINQFLKDSQ